MMKAITIGSDPEFFIKKDDEIITSIGKIGGNKSKYKPISENCSVHEDNVALEITFPESYSESEFVGALLRAMKETKEYISKKGFSLSRKASHEFRPNQLSSVSAKRFGCDPDYNALTGKVNPAPSSDTNIRSCGGHVAIGYMSHNEEMNRKIVLILDLLLGVPSVLLDDDNRRRELYGQASAFRNKEFGLEYRSLSNFWVFNSKYIKWVYRTAIKSVEMGFSGINIPEELSKEGSRVINTCDKEGAKKLIEKLKIEMP